MEIICDECGKSISDPQWKKIMSGDLEYTYFTCDECGAAHPVCTTDSALRKNIKKYRKMAARIRKGRSSEAYQKRVQKLKTENITRSRELSEQHPLASFLLHE